MTPAATAPAAPAPAAAAPAAPAPSTQPSTQPASTTPAAPPASTTPVVQPVAVRKPDQMQTAIDGLKAEIDQIAAALPRQGLSDTALAALRARAEAVKLKANKIIEEQSPGLAAASARLKQIGPAPQAKEGEPPPVESDAVRLERDAQSKAAAAIEGLIKQAQLIGLATDDVVKTVSDRRRARLTATLTERTRSVLDPGLWLEAVTTVPRTLTALQYLVGDWFGMLASRGGDVAVALLVFFSLGAAAAIIPIRARLYRIVERDPEADDVPPLRRSAAAAAIVAVTVGAPVAALLALYFTIQALDLGRDRTDQAFIAFIESVALGSAIYSLALAILAPAKPHWRLVAIPDPYAHRLRQLMVVLATAVATELFVISLLELTATAVSLEIAVGGLLAVIEAAIVIVILRTLAQMFAERDDGEASVPADSRPKPSIIWRWTLPLAWIVAISSLVAAVLGYVTLADFLAFELIWFGVVLAALFLVLQLIDQALTTLFQPGTPVSQSLTRSMGLSRETVEQIGVVLSGVGRLGAIFLAAYFVRPPWTESSSSDVLANVRQAFFGIKIGSFTFSAASLLIGLVTFGLGVAITRGIRSWLDQALLPRTRLDAGLKNSISTSFSYAGYVVAAIVAFSAIGIGLDNIAIVAGALSLGIGFGLQSIVNNFVSGLILLAERPIKAGDLVEIGAEKGFVRKINVRSTEIETFDRASLIVPNSTLISGSVKNWMHRDPSGRCVVDVGVTYDADAEQVRKILLAAAEDHPLVTRLPGPAAFLVGFGESALAFRLICAVENVSDAFGVESDLRFTVLGRLKKAGIDIPVPQREISVRQLSGLEALITAEAARRQPPAES
ncbi:MAG: DUF3772 domain-containing protein [Ancalomicrobiaceae bacterium]|nr:DUF3772 domain-containing protein [Ancalomicrobiaceae bacterium]